VVATRRRRELCVAGSHQDRPGDRSGGARQRPPDQLGGGDLRRRQRQRAVSRRIVARLARRVTDGRLADEQRDTSPMKALQLTIDGLYRWLDSVAGTIIGLAGWFRSRRAVRLVETERGTFVVAGREHAADAAESRIDIADGQVVGPVPESVASALRGSRA